MIHSRMNVNVSPRISFSNDISEFDLISVEKHIRSDSSLSVDFDFCVFRGSFDRESSSAYELFLDGKILPVEIKRRLALAALPKNGAEPPLLPPLPLSSPERDDKIDRTPKKTTEESEEKQDTKSVWRFKHCSSLNCLSSGRSFCPLPLLSQSFSTGSETSCKGLSVSEYSIISTPKQHKNYLVTSNSANPSQSVSSVSHKKPLLNKNNKGSNGINPMLNVHTANLFRFGSIFSGGKDKEEHQVTQILFNCHLT